jgi:hypothetical protein
MSDPLRDRIAQISRCQGHHHPDQPHVAECQAEPDEWDHELADAVIAELGRTVQNHEDLAALPFLAIVREEYTSTAGWRHSVIWERRSGVGSTNPEGAEWTAISAPLNPWEGTRPRNFPVTVLWPADWTPE